MIQGFRVGGYQDTRIWGYQDTGMTGQEDMNRVSILGCLVEFLCNVNFDANLCPTQTGKDMRIPGCKPLSNAAVEDEVEGRVEDEEEVVEVTQAKPAAR